MGKGVLNEKSFRFATRFVGLYKYLHEKKEYVLSKQILRCGTSVGAQVREAEFAESANDFIHKLAVAQKECNETLYWLELLKETAYLEKEYFDSINQDAIELIKILTAIIKTSKAK